MSLDKQITEFNNMYGLPCPSVPGTEMTSEALNYRLNRFYSILLEELQEVEDIEANISYSSKADVLTELADWLGDIMVYCASEMRKFGIPAEEVLDIIMKSNMSKLGEDGKPIIDGRGKVLKGPGYWKPEPMIKALILAKSPHLANEKFESYRS